MLRMIVWVSCLALFFSCAHTTPRNESKTPQTLPSIESFLQIRSASMPKISPDGTLYYLTWITGVNQLYRLKNKETVQLTDRTPFEHGVDFYSLSPDGRYLVLGGDIGGDEQYDLYLLDTHSENFTPNPIDIDRKVRAENIVWVQDSSYFLYRSNRRNGADFDVWRYTPGRQAPELFAELEGSIAILDISPDGKNAVLSRDYSSSLSELFLLDLETKKTTPITPPKRNDGRYFSAHFTKDSKDLIAISDDGLDRESLVKWSSDEKRWSVILKQDWPVEELEMAPDRGTIAYAVNEQGYSRLVIADAENLDKRAVPKLGMGVAYSMSFNETSLVFSYADSTHTADIWRYNLQANELEQLTFSDYAGIDRELFSEPRIVSYISFDGMKIPAILYLPKNRAQNPIPFVISAHGGPEGQSRPDFIRTYQFLLTRGIGVMAPNVRGSTGYSRNYMQLDNTTKRMDSVMDYKASAEWLIREGFADPKRIAIQGGSYGGFIVMASITEYPDLFAAAVDSVGIVNFISFLQNTKSYRRALREAEYGVLSDLDFLRSISPIFKIDRVKTPLLIIHGENDPRVPVTEARQIVDALTAKGQKVEALFFPDEGHGIAKLENRLISYKRSMDFLLEHLLP